MTSIFLSHSHADKPFVNRLATDLRSSGYYVWTDDAEIKIGDSLIQKIREGIDTVAYVGVVISSNSVKSEWVNKEVDIAMNQEIEGQRVKVLPLLLDNIKLPGFLIGKRYADFTDERLYDDSLAEIKKRLDEFPKEKASYNPDEAEYLLSKLKDLEAQLEISKSEKVEILTRLSIERKSMDPLLHDTIEEDAKKHPEFADINRNFSFMLGETPITAGYVIHIMKKEKLKGGPHQVVILTHLMNKTEELALLANATARRLKELSSSK